MTFPLIFSPSIAMLCWLSFGYVSAVQLPFDFTENFSLLISNSTHAKMNFFFFVFSFHDKALKLKSEKFEFSKKWLSLFFVCDFFSEKYQKLRSRNFRQKIFFLEHFDWVDSQFQNVEWWSWVKESCRKLWFLFFWVCLLDVLPNRQHSKATMFHVRIKWHRSRSLKLIFYYFFPATVGVPFNEEIVVESLLQIRTKDQKRQKRQ